MPLLLIPLSSSILWNTCSPHSVRSRVSRNCMESRLVPVSRAWHERCRHTGSQMDRPIGSMDQWITCIDQRRDPSIHAGAVPAVGHCRKCVCFQKVPRTSTPYYMHEIHCTRASRSRLEIPIFFSPFPPNAALHYAWIFLPASSSSSTFLSAPRSHCRLRLDVWQSLLRFLVKCDCCAKPLFPPPHLRHHGRRGAFRDSFGRRY